MCCVSRPATRFRLPTSGRRSPMNWRTAISNCMLNEGFKLNEAYFKP